MAGGIAAIFSSGFLVITHLQQERGVKAAEKSGEADAAGEGRAKREEEEKEQRAEGPPITSAPGSPAYYANRFAFPGRTTNLGAAASFVYGRQEYTDWFAANKAEEVGVSAYRVTLSPLHEGTVVVQNMRVSDLRCKPTKYVGTAVVPPAIGDGGDGVEPVSVGFDLSAMSPQPRQIVSSGDRSKVPGKEIWGLGVNAFKKGIYLDGGEQSDARSFDLYFFTGRKDCTFGIEVNVTSGSKDAWYPVKLGGKSGGRGSVAGQAERYQSVVLPTQGGGAQNELKGEGNPFPALELEKGKF
ncbi:hypothetical protein [Streptomyces platensis]|uniref:hypothetical protein n=1 Tax=Streptomyces platensis TaxID=58346 RepID=UPI002E811205|nr:hypothetical protein [Streptomyces platensis]WUB82359.1 hypothetical protein OG424_26115 [Streptomyces platensis]